MSLAEAPISVPERAPAPPQKRRSIAPPWKILIAVLLFDVAGAGTVLGLGEAKAAQRQQASLSLQVDHMRLPICVMHLAATAETFQRVQSRENAENARVNANRRI
jgi:hypothetical protein